MMNIIAFPVNTYSNVYKATICKCGNSEPQHILHTRTRLNRINLAPFECHFDFVQPTAPSVANGTTRRERTRHQNQLKAVDKRQKKNKFNRSIWQLCTHNSQSTTIRIPLCMFSYEQYEQKVNYSLEFSVERDTILENMSDIKAMEYPTLKVSGTKLIYFAICNFRRPFTGCIELATT